MDETVSQEQPIISTPLLVSTPIQEEPKKKKTSIWIWITSIIIIILFYIILRQQQLLNTNKQPISDNIIPIIEPTQIPTPTIQPELWSNNINKDYLLFENEELKVIFEYPKKWGKHDFNNKWNLGITFDKISDNYELPGSGLVFVATNPTEGPIDGMGGSWILDGYGLKTEDDFKKLCPEENETCKVYKNKNGIIVIKKYELPSLGANNKTNQYYIFNPNSLYSSIVISDCLFNKEIIPNAEKEVEDLVNSLRFINKF